MAAPIGPTATADWSTYQSVTARGASAIEHFRIATSTLAVSGELCRAFEGKKTLAECPRRAKGVRSSAVLRFGVHRFTGPGVRAF